jgi:hypothetical protein
MFQGKRVKAANAPERHRANDGSENFIRCASLQFFQFRFDLLEIRQLPGIIVAL